MPSVEDFLGILRHYYNELWRGLLRNVKIKDMLNRNKESNTSMAKDRYRNFLQHSYTTCKTSRNANIKLLTSYDPTDGYYRKSGVY
jgi:hypothetical protein